MTDVRGETDSLGVAEVPADTVASPRRAHRAAPNLISSPFSN